MGAGVIDPALLAHFEATWPPVAVARHGGLLVGRGAGGGGRLSSIRTVDAWDEGDLDAALAQQDAWDEPRRIRVFDGDDRLARAARARAMVVDKPTVILAAPLAALAAVAAPALAGFTVWPPLAVQRAIWTAHGVDGPRQAAMARMSGPRAAVLGRIGDRPGGAGFCAVSGPVAGLHALVVRPDLRGGRLGEWMLRAAARWAQRQGAEQMILAVQRGNAAALRLYDRTGFREIDGYVYCVAP